MSNVFAFPECRIPTIAATGPQVFTQAVAVVADHRIGGLKDGAGRTIVLFQPDDLRHREILLEFLDVFDSCTTPAIYRLVIVANHKHMVFIPCQQTYPGILDGVGVLEFIDKDMAESSTIVFQYLGVIAQQLQAA